MSVLGRLLAELGGRAVNELGVGAAGARTAPDIHENQEALSVAKGGHNRSKYDGLLETMTKPASVAGVERFLGTYSQRAGLVMKRSMLWAFSVEMESSSPPWNFNVSAGPRLSSSKPTLSI